MVSSSSGCIRSDLKTDDLTSTSAEHLELTPLHQPLDRENQLWCSSTSDVTWPASSLTSSCQSLSCKLRLCQLAAQRVSWRSAPLGKQLPATTYRGWDYRNLSQPITTLQCSDTVPGDCEHRLVRVLWTSSLSAISLPGTMVHDNYQRRDSR